MYVNLLYKIPIGLKTVLLLHEYDFEPNSVSD